MIKDYLIYFMSIMGGGYIAYWISSKKIKTSFIMSNYIIHYFFCLNFSLALGLFALLMQEIIFFKDKSDVIQEKLWMFEIKVLNFNLLLIGPVIMINSIVKFIKFGRLKVFFYIILYFTYFYFLIKSLITEANSMEKFKDRTGFFSSFGKILSKEVQFNYLIRMGGLIIAFLSGYGAINIPLENFSYIDKESLEEQYKRIEESFELAFYQIRYEKLELNRVMKIKAPKEEAAKKNIFQRIFSRKKEDKKEYNQILSNIKSSKTIFKESYEDYLDLKKEFKKYFDKKNRPFYYYLNRYLAILLLIISAQRIISTLITLFVGRSAKRSDPIAKIISIILRFFKKIF